MAGKALIDLSGHAPYTLCGKSVSGGLDARSWGWVMVKRILVIEDNEDIALVVVTTLRMREYDVVTASDGVQGLHTALSSKFDLIILDMLIPELDGHQVLSQLKSDPRTAHVPIAVFSAQMDEEDRRSVVDAGARAILIKPFEPRQFIKEVGALLDEDV